MKTKSFILCGLSVLLMILLLGVASADMVFNPTSFSTTITQGTSNVNVDFDLNHTGVGGNYTSLTWTGQSTQGTWTLPTSTTTLNVNESLSLSATLGSIPSSFSGTITANITVNNSGSPYEVLPVTITVTPSSSTPGDMCTVEFGELDENVSNPGDLKIKIDDMDNQGEGQDDEWYPSDEIEITIDLDNDGDEDIDDISIEYGLWSEEDDKWVIEIDEVDEINLGDGKDDTLTFTIDIYEDFEDTDDLQDGDYILYVRALGEVDDDNKSMTCASDSESVKLLIESDLVVLDNIKLTGTTFCGNTVQITADILNIGDDDQEGVYIMIHNFELGISEKAIVGDIDAFEDKLLDFEFTIPSDAEEKKYNIGLDVYDEDNDIYENEDDDKSKYTVLLDVSGNCEQIPDAVVYASLESGGKAGEELRIKATVTNNGDESDTFTIGAADYSSWAELVGIEPSSVTLNADESEDVIITFNVDEDAGESQTFNIVLSNSDGETTTQPVAVTIEQGFSMSSLVGDNPYLWGIAIASIVLVILIVVVAVRASRR